MGAGYIQSCTGTTEDLIRQSATLRAVIDEYEEHDIQTPKRLHRDLVDLAKRIKASHQAEQEAKLRTLEQEIEHLRSNEEKKQAKEKEAEELRKELGA
jgi:predicted RNase H-like nuclease (RuvC/YqgF family)